MFSFLALTASLSIILSAPLTKIFLTKDASRVTVAPLVGSSKERAFLWKDSETPYVVIIDNMKDAWPPQGLEFARVVFEAPVEAGITRFLAVFGSDEKEDFDIGPVRSARPYFVDWAEEFGTILAHVGGSPEALEKIKESRKVYGLDEFRYGGSYFTRQADRYAPHNTFTSLELLKKFGKKVLRQKSVEFNQWKTKDDIRSSDSKLSVSISYPDPYKVRWQYEPATNDYTRIIREKPYLAASGEPFGAKNVIILKTDITIIDNISRRKIVTQGAGEALIFQDGRVIEGGWKKANGFTKFYDKSGTEVAFNKGSVWIEVVNKNLEIIY